MSAATTEVDPAAPDPDVPDAATATGRKPWFRGDVDGLRAIAIVLVVLFHAGVPGFSGGFVGVDVFFVISGYLITRILLDQASSTGRVGLLQFWAKRIRRLVPAMGLMVVVVLVASWFILSPLEWPDVAKEGGAATLYISNIVFARSSLGYFDQGISESPFLHTWSLGVEEQFYLVWPVLVAAACLVARNRRRLVRPTLVVGFGITFVVSLALCVWFTRRNSPWAFYSLPTRAFEFAAAGLLAALPTHARSRALLLGATVVGIAVLVWTTLVLSPATAYPGLWALLPVGATLLLITGGDEPRSGSTMWTTRALSVRPMQWLGRVSYSWYLWHWPFMILAVAAFNRDTVGIRLTAGLVALPVAALTYAKFENRLRFNRNLVRSKPLTYAFGLAITLAVLGVALVLNRQGKAEVAREPYASLAETKRTHRASPPCTEDHEDRGFCVDGDLDGDKTVLLVGDSHARQWQVAFTEAAKAQGIRLVSSWTNACPAIPVPTVRGPNLPADRRCRERRETDRALIEEYRPSAVVIAQSSGYHDKLLDGSGRIAGDEEQLELWRAGYETLFAELRAEGVRPVVVLDNPRLPFDPVLCLARNGTEEACAASTDELDADAQRFKAVEREAVARESANGVDVATMDPTLQLCPDGRCDVQVDGVVVFPDDDHLSRPWTLGQRAAIEQLLEHVVG